METSSRIFARNLPPNLTEADFRKHFAQRFPASITDVKLFPQRRIGYVGLKTPADAAAAVKYFNKTFIRMSRIHIEIASAPSPKTHRISRPMIKGSDSQAKTQDLNDRPAKRQKRVDNDTDAAVEEKSSGQALEKPNSSPQQEVQQEIQKELQQQQQTIADEGSEEKAPADDMDWMRSRTTRLLGLADDDQDDGNAMVQRESQATDTPAAPLATPEQEPTPPPEEGEDESQPEEAHEITTIKSSGRLFLRNLPYTAQEEDLRQHFQSKGSLQSVHVPVDAKTGTPKGFAFVEFQDAEDAVAAYKDLDGTTFQGRLLHVLPAAAKRENKLDELAMSKLPVKKQKMLEKKAQASSSSFNWNSLYMNADAVMSSVADRLGVSKSEIFDPTSSDAGVKQAQAETHVIQETRAYFEDNGVDITAFSRRERGDTGLLVKNFPYGTTSDELKSLFGEAGELTRILLPPSGTIAILEFAHKTQARAAFATFSYRKYKDSVLFLEKAPKDLFRHDAGAIKRRADTQALASEPAKLSTSDLMQGEAIDQDKSDASTLYVRNLNFSTTNSGLEQTFKMLPGFLSARVKTKTDAKKPGQVLSMGFGFVEFSSSAFAQAALKAMDGYSLDGHSLVVKASHKGQDAAEERRKEDEVKRQKARKSRLIIKNLPFEASKKDVRALFKTYGQLRSVRLPNKFDGSRKGYAFAEFTTPKEAENAMDALRNTHLLGRRLVIDFAQGEAEDAEAEIGKMQQKVDRQTSSIALQRLTAASERKKFVVGDMDESNG